MRSTFPTRARMLAFLGAVLFGVSDPIAQAQPSTESQTPKAAADAQDQAPAGIPPGELEKLVAPIALYPDVLVSQILPASTYPTDIAIATRWVRENPDLKDVDKQKWDLSVCSLCRYPSVLEMMSKDPDWTNALGAAFLSQPEDVMAAIQYLRRQAHSAGVLESTEEQAVVLQGSIILIVPTQKDVVYVPQYNYSTIYVEDDDDDELYYSMVAANNVTSAAIAFGAGVALGAWLDSDCDWDNGYVVACRPGYWGGYHWHGAVAWDDDWVAMRGPRRGYVAGENGGAYVGPRGAAIWGDNGRGAAWARTPGRGSPVYTGRYAAYDNVNVSGNRRNVVAGNEVNINRNNVNIDRGDRPRTTTARTGAAATGTAADRAAAVGAARTTGDRAARKPDDGAARPAADRARANSTGQSAFADRGAKPAEVNKQRDRGQQSRATTKPAAPANQPQAKPQARPQPSKSDTKKQSSAFNQRSSGGQAQRQSSRGATSRSGGGGGAARGGGGGGRRGR